MDRKNKEKSIVQNSDETKKPSKRGRVGEGRPKKFATETAAIAKTSRSAISQDLKRAKDLGTDLHRIAGTSLDKGVEMDALIKMNEPERKKVIERAAQGEQVSAVVIGNTAPWQIASRRSFQINRRLTFIGKPCLTQKPKRPWRGFQQR